MQAVAGVAAIVIAVAAAVAVYRATFRSFQDTWQRVPPERRGLAGFGIGMMIVAGIAGAVLLIVQPWGTNTVVWVILVGLPLLAAVWIMAVSVHVMLDRRERKRRAPNP